MEISFFIIIIIGWMEIFTWVVKNGTIQSPNTPSGKPE